MIAMLFRHFRIRLLATLASPTSMFMLLVAGWSSLLLWPWFLRPSLPYAPARVDLFVHLIFIFVWPMMVAFGTLGAVESSGAKPSLVLRALPALPIGRRARAVAEALAPLLIALVVRFVFAEVSLLWFGLREPVTGEPLGWTDFAAETAQGTLLLLPGVLAWVSPVRPGRLFVLYPLTVATVTFAALQLGLIAIPVVGPLFLAGLAVLVLILAGHESGWEDRLASIGPRRATRYRPGLAPEVRFRRDQWAGPLRRWGLMLAGFVVIGVTVVALDYAGVLTEDSGDLYYGLVFGLSFSLIGMLVLFPLGVHLFQTDRGGRDGSMMTGTFCSAWSTLPVRRLTVIRAVYLHGLVAGVVWFLFLGGLLLLAHTLELRSLRMLRFFLPLLVAVPAVAGVLTCTAVGDKVRGLIAFLAVLLVLPVHIGVETATRWAGLLHGSPSVLAIDLALLALLGAIGGLPPLVHLRLRSRRPAALLVVALLFIGCAGSGEPRLTEEQRRANLETLDQVWNTIRDKHFDPELGGVDWETARESYRKRMELVETMSGARRILNELLEELGHSHVGIIPSDAYETGNDEGVPGLEVRVIDGQALVTAVWEEFPAAKTGVRPGWEIVRVGRQRIAPLLDELKQVYAGHSWEKTELTLHVQSLLRGPVGGTLDVRFRDSEDRKIKLRLGLVQPRGERFQAGLLAPEWAWIEARRIDGEIGYIAFNSFSYPTYMMPVFNEAMESFLNARGVILDLRGNTGGMGGMVAWMAGWLVQEKNTSLGTMPMRDNELRFIVQPRPETFDGPLAILIDEVSVSAAEMLASGLQGIGRARLFGTLTAGASLPAQLEKLPNGDTLMFPSSRHLTPGGEPVEGRGVEPDVEVRLTREALLQERDPVLETALNWIRNPESSKEVTKP
jgi:carboxyl-terminal processing protease